MTSSLRTHENSAQSEQKIETPLDAENWRLEPHVCRVCFSRIASRPSGDKLYYACTNCGFAAISDTPASVCSCGIKLRKPVYGRAVGVPSVDAGVRCQPNPSPRPDFPSQFVATHVGAPKGPGGRQ